MWGWILRVLNQEAQNIILEKGVCFVLSVLSWYRTYTLARVPGDGANTLAVCLRHLGKKYALAYMK